MSLENCFVCLHCGKEKPFDYPYQYQTFLCDGCAEHVANHWHRSHSGSYITWPNPQSSHRDHYFVKTPISSKLRWEVFKRDGYKCVECQSEHDLSADHKHPESLGGDATLDNLQTLCRPCNSRKGAAING